MCTTIEGNCPDSVIRSFADGADAEAAYGPWHAPLLSFVKKLYTFDRRDFDRLIDGFDVEQYKALCSRAVGLTDQADALLGYVSVELCRKFYPREPESSLALRARIMKIGYGIVLSRQPKFWSSGFHQWKLVTGEDLEA